MRSRRKKAAGMMESLKVDHGKKDARNCEHALPPCGTSPAATAAASSVATSTAVAALLPVVAPTAITTTASTAAVATAAATSSIGAFAVERVRAIHRT